MHEKLKGMNMLDFFFSVRLIQKRILLKLATEGKFVLPKTTVDLGLAWIC